jgi:hypothetical protein
MNDIKKLEPLKDLFELLYLKLKGFNKEEDLFDFYYDNYTFTLIYRNNQINLANNVDVYDEHENFIGNFTLEEINNISSINNLKD